MRKKKVTISYEPYDHKGMRISFSGMMNQVKNQLEVFEKIKDEYTNEETGELEAEVEYFQFGGLRGFYGDLECAVEEMSCCYSHTVKELMDHFKIMGEAFSDGNLRTVDNVLQLWCLKERGDEIKPRRRKIGPQKSAANRQRRRL